MRNGMLAMALGIALASFLPIPPDFFQTGLPVRPAVLALLLGLAALALLRRVPVLASLFVGLTYGCAYAIDTYQHLLQDEHEAELQELSGYVVGLPVTEQAYGKPISRFDFAVLNSRWPVSAKPLRYARLSWYEAPPIQAGQLWTVRARLKRPRGLANPGGFDYQQYLHQQRIDARGSVVWGEALEAELGLWAGLQQGYAKTRGALALQLQQALGHSSSQHLVRALALGDGKALSAQDWELLRATGTTHLFVISGLHISLFGGLVYLLVLPLCRLCAPLWPQWPAQGFAAGVASLAALAYAALAGFSLPTQRALIMFTVLMLALHSGRLLRVTTVLALAALAVLLLDPLAARSAGFHLSFLAVLALLYAFGQRLSPGLPWILSLLKAQWVSFVALSPLLLLWFQSTSLLMPLANLLAVPLLSLIVVPLVLLLLTLAGVLGASAVPQFLIALADTVLQALWAYLSGLNTQFAEQSTAALAPGMVILLPTALAVLLILSPLAVRQHARYLVPLLLLPLAWQLYASVWQPGTASSRAQCRPARLTVLDAGQGTALVFSANGKSLVYDTGARFSDKFDIGSAVLIPFLRHEGVSRIDSLVISHSDNDHAGGLSSVLAAMPVDALWSSYDLAQRPPQYCHAGAGWRWPGVEFRFLGPARLAPGSDSSSNAQSCVLQIRTERHSVLLPGDIDQATEHELLARWGEELHSDIILVPHHGSRSSSSAQFVDSVDADYAVVSAAYRSRFGHPHPQVVERYQAQGATLLNTASQGALSFELPLCADRAELPWSAYRQSSGNYWLPW